LRSSIGGEITVGDEAWRIAANVARLPERKDWIAPNADDHALRS
jgi:hypothetical protein